MRFSSWRDGKVRALPLILAGGVAIAGVLALVVWAQQERPMIVTNEVPDHFVELKLSRPPSDRALDTGAPQPKREEGRVGKAEARLAKPAAAAKSAKMRPFDRETANNSGVLGALPDSAQLSSDATTGMNGLVGARSTQTGSAGLGARGSGLGGGGTADGLGTLGTQGRASGASGYGSGGGSYGAKGDGADARAQYYALRAAQQQARAVTNTEQYTDHGTNAMTLATDDGLSTFSVDVDTASFTIARKKLDSGALPPEGAVRVEEFVNYFPYSYRKPTDGSPFAVNLEAAPHPWNTGRAILRVGVQGREVAKAKQKPRRLTFLVDVSGSMQKADKLPLVQSSLRTLVDNLGPEDSVALVTYAGSTRVVCGPTPMARRAELHEAIDALTAGGSTAMGSGIQLAYEQAMLGYVAGAENRVLVLSDGDANVGATSHDQLLASIAGYAKKGVSLSVLGFGMGNYKDSLMEQFADKGDGNYYYIDSQSEAQRVFGKNIAGTLEVIARDVKIQVEFDPSVVHAWRLIGYENRDVADKDFRNDKVDAGEVGSGHSVTAVYELILKDGARTSGGNVATVRLRAKAPGPDAPSKEYTTSLAASQMRSELASASADTRLAFAAASFAERLRGSRYAGELSYDQILALARGAARPGVAEDKELIRLIQRAKALTPPDESEVATRP